MDKKKGIVETVTQSGWWRQQLSPKQGSAESTIASEKQSLENAEAEPKAPNEGVLTGAFRKLNLFETK